MLQKGGAGGASDAWNDRSPSLTPAPFGVDGVKSQVKEAAAGDRKRIVQPALAELRRHDQTTSGPE